MTVPIRNIMVPTDFSKQSDHALLYAASLGERYGAKIHLVHVVTLHDVDRDDSTEVWPDMSPYLDAADQAARDKLDAGAEHGGEAVATVERTLLRSVNAHEAIIKHASENSIDLIIIGMRGRSSLSYMLLGSVTERVIRYAPCPVMVVEKGDRDFVDPATAAVRLDRVVMAHDLTDNSHRALAYVTGHLKRYAPEMHLVHALNVEIPAAYVQAGVTEGLPLNPNVRDKLTEALAKSAGEIIDPAWTTVCQIVQGKPHKAVTDYAKEIEADMLVVGSETRHDLGERIVGGTSVRIVRHAPCPTLIC